jgi:predicted NAD/FAD-binding protein
VFNERTYPGLIAFLDELQVPTIPSDMSFSVQVPGAGALGAGALEWSGSNLATVFAQKRNLLRLHFWGMLSELLRFNRLCTALADSGQELTLAQPLGEFLDQHGFGAAFRHWYFLPMMGCIWSCPTDQMLRFPVATMVSFLPQPRPHPGAKPAAVAHRGGRGTPVCQRHLAGAGCASGHAGYANRAQCRRRAHPHGQRR